MKAFWKYLVLFGILSVIVIGTASAHGDDPPVNTHGTTRETVNWTIPAGQCPAIPDGLSVSGTGERHAVVNIKTNADGSSRIIINDVVRGSAVDSNGDTYRFIYSNHSIETVPPDGSGLPHQIEMNDNFVLNGQGDAGNLEVGFVWSWTYTPPDPLFPPVDNWVQHNTRGDPFSCDPI